jgi:hypothetical protein
MYPLSQYTIVTSYYVARLLTLFPNITPSQDIARCCHNGADAPILQGQPCDKGSSWHPAGRIPDRRRGRAICRENSSKRSGRPLPPLQLEIRSKPPIVSGQMPEQHQRGPADGRQSWYEGSFGNLVMARRTPMLEDVPINYGMPSPPVHVGNWVSAGSFTAF